MSPASRHKARFACLWLLACLLHELVVCALSDSTQVASLFAPGTHTPWLALAIAAAYFALRLSVLLLWPVALASGLSWIIQRARTSPLTRTHLAQAEPAHTRRHQRLER
jgi:hypothetical protein